MVKPPRRSLVLPSMVLCAVAGCSLTPKSQLDECRQRGQALRTENDRLKDQVLSLRSENQDIAQRSVDDERQLKAQEEAIARLEETVEGYRKDREQLAALQDRLKGQIQSTSGPEASRAPEGLGRFAQNHPDASFNAASGVLTLPVDKLFRRGAARLQPEADGLLKDLASVLAAPEFQHQDVVLTAPTEDASVVRASHDSTKDEPARARFLAMSRANQLRERLAKGAEIDPTRIRIANPDETPPGSEKPTEPDAPAPARVEIRLAQPTAQAAASGP